MTDENLGEMNIITHSKPLEMNLITKRQIQGPLHQHLLISFNLLELVASPPASTSRTGYLVAKKKKKKGGKRLTSGKNYPQMLQKPFFFWFTTRTCSIFLCFFISIQLCHMARSEVIVLCCRMIINGQLVFEVN